VCIIPKAETISLQIQPTVSFEIVLCTLGHSVASALAVLSLTSRDNAVQPQTRLDGGENQCRPFGEARKDLGPVHEGASTDTGIKNVKGPVQNVNHM